MDDNGIGHFYNHWNESIKIYKNINKTLVYQIILIANLIFLS